MIQTITNIEDIKSKGKGSKVPNPGQNKSIVAIFVNSYLPSRNQDTLGNVWVVCKEGSTKKFKLQKDDNNEINGQDNKILE